MTALLRHRRSPRTHVTLLTALFAAVAVLVAMPGAPVGAAPGDSENIGELEKKLGVATRAYNNAKGRVKASRKKQAKLDKEIKVLEGQAKELHEKVGHLASAVYKGSWAGSVTALMEAGSPSDLADGMTTVSFLAARDYKQIKAFAETRDQLAKKRYAVQLEMRKQRAELKKMAKRKKDALKALIAAGGGDPTGGPDGGAPTADPSPRAPDGSWPPEACTADDPTTGGCLTPRTKHALEEAREAGYTRYTKCWRESSGDHGNGKACDFAAFTDGFRNEDAYGENKQYGDNLAGWFVANADALGINYVIWYRRIWMQGSGWGSYNGGGDPASDHTNHVHISVH